MSFLSRRGDAAERTSCGWLIAAGCMILFIWGNSLVPGTGSSHLSLSVVSTLRSWLSEMGLPSAWVTNLLVRKMAHFSEYALLSILLQNAFSRGPKLPMCRFAAICGISVLVACVDESIQHFVPGRCGTPIDVLIDSCGAAFGILICLVIGYVSRQRSVGHR